MLTSNDEFKLFFQEHFEPLYRFARKYTGDAEIARDMAQESFTRLYERRAAFDSWEKARSFLYTATRNGCLDHLKHLKTRRRYLPDDSDDDTGFLHEVTYQETSRLLHAAIARLPPRGRAVILHSMNGKNNDEIATAMQVSVNTVKTLKKGAYATLRALLRNALLLLLTLP
jgi:RNA polymerase sigma-70 factor (ECF subfamily)